MILLPLQQEEPDKLTLRSFVRYLHVQTRINLAFSPHHPSLEFPPSISHLVSFKKGVSPPFFVSIVKDPVANSLTRRGAVLSGT